MKLSTTNLTLTALAVAAFSGAPAMAALDSTYNPGDLLLGFRATSGTGVGTNIIVNLGASTIYRDTTSDILNFGSIGGVLDTVYGDGWENRTNLFSGIMGANNGIGIDNGQVGYTMDPNATVYISGRRTNFTTAGVSGSTTPGGTPPGPGSLQGLVQPAASGIGDLGFAFAGYVPAPAGGIGQLDTSTTNGWNTFTTGNTSSDIGGFFNVERAYAAGTVSASFGAAGAVDNIFDLFRVAEFAPSGQTVNNPGRGQFLGSFTIDSDGDLSFIDGNTEFAFPVNPVPEPASGFFGLATVLGLAARRKRTQATA